MVKFSIRNGFAEERVNDPYDSPECQLTDIECAMAEIGVHYEFPYNRIAKQKNAETLMKYVIKNTGCSCRV